MSYRDGNIFEVLASVKRNPFPKRVVYSTFSLRYSQAYWLRIDQIKRGLELARIEGNLTEKIFAIQAENISAFSILLDPQLVPAGESIQVEVAGKVAFSGVPQGEVLSFSQLPDGSFVQKKWDSGPVGPPDHMEAGFRNRTIAQAARHMYVYGTGGDAETQKASKELAEELANWGPEIKVRWRIVADKDVTASELEAYNLVLVGSSALNRLVARMREKLPLLEQDGEIRAGSQTVRGKDVAYRLIYPNPLAPGRYVYIHAAGTARGLKNLRRLAQPSWFPDRNADYLLLDDQGAAKAAGLFKDRWEIGQ